ncbi:MAG: hypothetical protein MJE63_22155 [Proteobacteria bacterium]|nr:hypothetical protein [Pseudomonadota bacterium]
MKWVSPSTWRGKQVCEVLSFISIGVRGGSPSHPSVVQRTFAATHPSYGLGGDRFIDKQATGGKSIRVF